MSSRPRLCPTPRLRAAAINPTLYKYPTNPAPHHYHPPLPTASSRHTRAAQAAQTRQNGELSSLSLHRASHPSLVGVCVCPDRGCAAPMQVIAQKTKEAEITEQDSLLLVSLLLISSPSPRQLQFRAIRVVSGGSPPIESLLLDRDVRDF